MSFFQSLGSSEVSYDSYIDSIVAGALTPQYTGISALKNSDILTATSIIADCVVAKEFPMDNVIRTTSNSLTS